ncbi:MAG TPA: PSD1 and planctomycete cytochrome C domain-containing protein, partial [Pirellulales bacterium]|nr:PSD1 and planctomycete cytochrome C domain-containing protein [Pirellulales bacterium]
MPRVVLLSSAVVASFFAAAIAIAGEPTTDELAFFEKKIRPVLVKHCYECHSASATEIGGKLLLDSRDGMRKGGESGPVLIAGQPDKSVLIRALRYHGLEMPPDAPLPEAIVNDFATWIRLGAADPRIPKAAPETTAAKPVIATVADRPNLWSLEPVQHPQPPALRNQAWVRDPIDRFVLARIEAEGLVPAADADPRTLVRRLHYDLIGLPPSYAETERFVAVYRQHAATAIAECVDRLLATPQFGEHWGRYWLDVARYAESNGNDGLGRNPTFPHAWRYRDYVIAALNDDMPFDQFVTEQIAGDLMPSNSPAERDRRLIATGFLALCAKPAKAMNTNFEMDVVADQLDLIGRGFLGLSIGCARCHDHKFDPIPTRDYYALAGILTSTETLWGTAANEGLTAPATDLHVLKAAPPALPPAGFIETVLMLDSATGKPKPVPKAKWPAGTPLAMGVRDRAKPADAKIHIKGEGSSLGEVVPRGFLSAISLPQVVEAADDDAGTIGPEQSGRLQLAAWVAHADNPLTARVLVNRIWQQMFGEGIVRTPDDFGVYGEPPSDRQLLDYLASRFAAEGWSVKKLIRAVALSRTYQLGVEADAKLLASDPLNRRFARHERRRLSAEALRDAMLHASGQLDRSPGDGSLVGHRDILVNLAGSLHQPSRRRSVYLCYLRSSPPPELAPFDLPEFTSVTGRRDISTVPGQALHLYNSPFVVEQAEQFARGVVKDEKKIAGRIAAAWRRAYGR